MTASPSEPSYRPPRVSLGGVTVGVLIVSLLTLPTGAGGYLTALGGVVLVVGVLVGSRRGFLIGVAGVYGGVIVAGATGSAVGTVAIASVATILAYDAGHLAIDLGEQMRSSGTTGQAELTHLGGTMIVAAGAAGVGYLGYELAGGGQPTTALVALLLAGILLLWALRS